MSCEIPGEDKRRWPNSIEKIQSGSRVWETKRVAIEGDSVSWIGESRTATRRRWVGSAGLGIVKERKQERIIVSKVFMSGAIESGLKKKGGKGKKGKSGQGEER